MHNEYMQLTPDSELNLDAALTIGQLTVYFFGEVSYKCIDRWVRRGLLTPVGKDGEGRVLIRLGDALEVEASTWKAKPGRPRRVAA